MHPPRLANFFGAFRAQTLAVATLWALPTTRALLVPRRTAVRSLVGAVAELVTIVSTGRTREVSVR